MSKITESARGEPCLIRLPGICNHDKDTTVWCHPNNLASGKGVGLKGHDLLGAYGCFNCHNVVDRRMGPSDFNADITWPEIEVAFHEGHQRSVLRLIEKGIVRVERGTVLVQE